ncbi:MAG: FHA domain-containing protein [Planctomycetota bacterium]|nr:FHA domain-containing protein [Planctomycetota bacterium]
MAKFVVKIKDKISKGKVAPFQAEVDAIDLGTRAECAVSFNDPIASDRHCRIAFADGEFRIEDLGSAVGTYVSGFAVTKPTALSDGDHVLIGFTRFVVSLDGETLTLDGEIGGFAYEGGDLDRWVEDEVAFGRYAPVRVGNWLAVFALLLLVPAVFVDAVEEPLFDPGPLNPQHAQLFGDRSKLRADLLGFADIAARDGCMTCHDGFDRTPMQKCAQCHEEMMEFQHPFRLEPTPDGDPGNSERGFEAHDCLLCHVDHRGDEAVRPGFIPESKDTPNTCWTCHHLIPDPERAPTPVPLSRRFGVAYETFPHEAHLQGGQEIACGACHQRAAVAEGDDPRRRDDFAPVQYETCMLCHDADESRRDAALADHWSGMDARLAFRVDWHGTGDECLACHSKLNAADLKRVATVDVELFFEVERRSHHPEFAAGAGGRACGECHVDGVPLSAGRTVTAKFRHGVHLPDLASPEGCVVCHVEIVKGGELAAGLAEGGYTGAQGRCEECHADEPGGRSLVLGPAAAEASTQVSRNDIPHALHLGTGHTDLEGGCFACHGFTAPEAPFAALPTTLPEAADCSSCHLGTDLAGNPDVPHRNVGGGSCTWCHLAGDPVWTGEPLVRDWPAANFFDHWGTGHAEPTNDGRCYDCHEVAGTKAARSVSQVPIPDESLQLCRDCHLDQRQRFHWR